MIDINELRRMAQAATSGPWQFWHGWVAADIDNDGGVIIIERPTPSGGKHQARVDNNFKFIAAANPATINELLDRLEAAESALSNLGVTPDEARDGLARHKALMARLEAAEKELVELRLGISKQQSLTDAAQQLAEAAQRRADKLKTKGEAAEKERDAAELRSLALRAKIAEMEKQEPVVIVDYKRGNCLRWVEYLGWQKIKDGTKLYALPGAQGEGK